MQLRILQTQHFPLQCLIILLKDPRFSEDLMWIVPKYTLPEPCVLFCRFSIFLSELALENIQTKGH